MCLLAIFLHVIPDAPVAVAANRDEHFARPSLAPQLYEGPPRVVCGIDERAGGTWLGVNEHGLLAAVTNRPRRDAPAEPRSRGLLCRELLDCARARAAADRAASQLATGRYAGANYVCLDARGGAVVCGGDEQETIDLEPGIHLMTNGDLDDPGDQRLAIARALIDGSPPASLGDFLTLAARMCADPGIVVRAADRGTVSSDHIAMPSRPARAVWRHAPGSPDQVPYGDCSDLLRRVLMK